MDIESAAREVKAGRAIAGELLARAKFSAQLEARTFRAFRYIVLSKHGAHIVDIEPVMGDYYAVTPSGVVAYVKGQRI